MALLTPHPNIVSLFKYWQKADHSFLLLEHCDGGDLGQRLKETEAGHLQTDLIWSVLKQLLQALNHCHANGIIHGELSPENGR